MELVVSTIEYINFVKDKFLTPKWLCAVSWPYLTNFVLKMMGFFLDKKIVDKVVNSELILVRAEVDIESTVMPKTILSLSPISALFTFLLVHDKNENTTLI